MKYQKNSNIALILITCNQKDVTKKTIRLLKKQTIVPDIIVIDNNSSDGTKEALEKDFFGITILCTRENYGSSGGQYIGTRYAYEKGYTWIIMSDNDAFPVSKSLIEELVKNASENIVTQPWNIDEDLKESNNFWSMHYACYHRKIFKRLGFPLFEFFLYGDDGEFLYRLKKNSIENKKMDTLFYSHPMKRSYLPSRFYLNHRNYLNITLFYETPFVFFVYSFLLLNSLFIYKIIGENDYYSFGLRAFRNFISGINDNSPIKKENKIFSPLIISNTKKFKQENIDAFVNIHKKTNKFLEMKSFYGKVKTFKNLTNLLRHKKMLSESVINWQILLYSFLFNRVLLCIDDINERNVQYREYRFPSLIKKIVLLMFYNISHLYIILAIAIKVIFLSMRGKNLYYFNEKYDSLNLINFYEN